MKNILLCLFTFLLLSGCSNNKEITEDQANQVKAINSPEVAALVDSLNKLNIYIPPVFDKGFFDSSAAIDFYSLAQQSDGQLSLLINSDLIAREIANIIEKYAVDSADLVLLIDQTGSMEDDIERVKAGLKQIIAALNTHKNIRLALAFYGDKNVDGIFWFLFKDFGHNYGAASNMLSTVSVTGGGDIPESVYDAVFEIDKMEFWRSNRKRMILLVGDAPPLEKPYSDYTLEDVVKKAKEDKVEMNFYPIIVTPHTDEAAAVAPDIYKDTAIITNLYPNPVRNTMNITCSTAGDYAVTVYNSKGQAEYTGSFSGNTWQHDCSSLSDGVYIVQVISKDHLVGYARFLMQH